MTFFLCSPTDTQVHFKERFFSLAAGLEDKLQIYLREARVTTSRHWLWHKARDFCDSF